MTSPLGISDASVATDLPVWFTGPDITSERVIGLVTNPDDPEIVSIFTAGIAAWRDHQDRVRRNVNNAWLAGAVGLAIPAGVAVAHWTSNNTIGFVAFVALMLGVWAGASAMLRAQLTPPPKIHPTVALPLRYGPASFNEAARHVEYGSDLHRAMWQYVRVSQALLDLPKHESKAPVTAATQRSVRLRHELLLSLGELREHINELGADEAAVRTAEHLVSEVRDALAVDFHPSLKGGDSGSCAHATLGGATVRWVPASSPTAPASRSLPSGPQAFRVSRGSESASPAATMMFTAAL